MTCFHSKWRQTDLLFAAIFLITLSSGNSVAASVKDSTAGAQESDSQVIWRANRFDGINCLSLMLSNSDKDTPWTKLEDDLSHGDSQLSLQDLHEIAGRHGLATSIVKCGPSDIASLPKPLIAHLRDLTGDGGGYMLLVWTDDTKVVFLNGGQLILTTQTWDDFRRSWSGYVLIKEAKSKRIESLSYSILIGATVFTVLRVGYLLKT